MTPGGQRRLVCGVVGLAALGVVGLSLWVKPDARGYGTHEALGLPPCGLKFVTNIPCPSCGMTTSFAHAARLDWRCSLDAHPGGLVLFGAVAITAIVSLSGLVGSPAQAERAERWVQGFPWWQAGIAFFAVFLMIWVYRALGVVLS